jgi:opacity protein-like surface antigen
MMHKFLISAGLLGLLTTSAFAGDTSFYIKALGGGVLESPQLWNNGIPQPLYPMNGGWDAGATLGYYLSDNFSVETDVFHTNTTYNCCAPNGLQSTSVMGNVVGHLNVSGPVGVYGGLGVGAVDVAYVNLNPASNGNAWVFGGQAFGGVEVSVSKNISLLAEYRYQLASNAQLNLAGFGSTTVGYNASLVSAGLEFKF